MYIYFITVLLHIATYSRNIASYVVAIVVVIVVIVIIIDVIMLVCCKNFTSVFVFVY